jgi:alanyl-tRNA synthetase
MRREYWLSPDLLESKVVVNNIGSNLVSVEPNIFHPNEGGQPCDLGKIGNAKVISVDMREGSIVIELDEKLSDGKYTARVDKKNRLFTSRHHTAQHIISGIAESLFNLKTMGVHIGEHSTIDFDKEIDSETLESLELYSNRVVMDDIPVLSTFGSAPSRFDERINHIDSEDIRVVSIGDIDNSACCGAHVLSTGNVGYIRIVSNERKRGGSRIEFLAGEEAVLFSRNETNVLAEIRTLSSCSNDELVNKFSNLLESNKKLQQDINHIWSRNLSNIAENCGVLDINGNKVGLIIEIVPKKIQGKLMSVLLGANDAGIIISDRSISIYSDRLSSRDLLDTIIGKVGGKGGGNDRIAKGYLSASVSENDIKRSLSINE